MVAVNQAGVRYHIEPYHMNGLNWRLAEDRPERDNIVVVTGFMPTWWTAEYGITFGAGFHLDAGEHRATLARMEAILRERFGDLPNFFCGDGYADAWPMERRYGDALIPALFGSDVSFEDASGHPYAPGLALSGEHTERLTAPDIEANPVTRCLAPPAEAACLRVCGELGFEGVINVAYKLRGQELFVDLLEAPARAEHLFDVVQQTIAGYVRQARRWQDPSGKRPTYFVTCDCLINMLSPRLYRRSLLPFDQRFAETIDVFGVHTCNWTVDPYLDALAEMPNLAYLDMGPDSDIDRVHSLFPDLCPSVFVHPKHILEMSEAEIGRTISELSRRIGRGFILLSDLEAGTTDSKICAAYEAAARFA